MTTEEVKNLSWCGTEKFALVNIKTKNIFLGSDEKDVCVQALNRMGTNHPLYYKLCIVERPK